MLFGMGKPGEITESEWGCLQLILNKGDQQIELKSEGWSEMTL